MKKSEVMKLVKELYEDVKVFALMTVDSGYPVARPMNGLIFHNQNTILLTTHKNSRKFKQIAKEPIATLFMYDRERYLNIRGVPSIEDDPKLKKKYWRDSWMEYYGNDAEMEDFAFLKLTIEHISYKDFLNEINIEMDF